MGRLARGARCLLIVVVSSCGVSEREETALGEEYAREVEREMPIVHDATVTSALSEIATRITASADQRVPWRFAVIDINEVNAFAIPGGHVYVNRGLLHRARNINELAGVLGHEIGHVLLRHSAQQLEKQRTGNVVVTIICSVTSFCNSEAARTAISVGGAALFARYSRNDELEADSASVALLSRAGFDPRGVSAFFGRLLVERDREPALVETWFASHPLEETRITHANAVIARIGAIPRSPADDAAFVRLEQRLAMLPPARELPAARAR
jgi:beta-barrel assembly-enhancing protease